MSFNLANINAMNERGSILILSCFSFPPFLPVIRGWHPFITRWTQSWFRQSTKNEAVKRLSVLILAPHKLKGEEGMFLLGDKLDRRLSFVRVMMHLSSSSSCLRRRRRRRQRRRWKDEPSNLCKLAIKSAAKRPFGKVQFYQAFSFCRLEISWQAINNSCAERLRKGFWNTVCKYVNL